MALPEPQRDENPGIGPIAFIIGSVAILLLIVLLNMPG